MTKLQHDHEYHCVSDERRAHDIVCGTLTEFSSTTKVEGCRDTKDHFYVASVSEIKSQDC